MKIPMPSFCLDLLSITNDLRMYLKMLLEFYKGTNRLVQRAFTRSSSRVVGDEFVLPLIVSNNFFYCVVILNNPRHIGKKLLQISFTLCLPTLSQLIVQPRVIL